MSNDTSELIASPIKLDDDNYYEHIVSFIDVLGYGNVVKNDNLVQKLMDTLVECKNLIYIAKKQGIFAGIFTLSEVEIRLMSDTILITAPLPKDYSAKYSMDKVFVRSLTIFIISSIVQYTFMKRGFLCRGGISLGKFYSKESIVFGEGLANAASIEKKTEMPRIEIDSKVYELFLRSTICTGNVFDDKNLLRIIYIDDKICINYLELVAYCDILDENPHNSNLILGELRQGIMHVIKNNLPFIINEERNYNKYNYIVNIYNYYCGDNEEMKINLVHELQSMALR